MAGSERRLDRHDESRVLRRQTHAHRGASTRRGQAKGKRLLRTWSSSRPWGGACGAVVALKMGHHG
eukprot:2200076-Prymnesium_polylepis.1